MRRAGAAVLGALAAAMPSGVMRAADPPPQMFESDPVLVCPDGSYEGVCDSEDVRSAVQFGKDHAAAIETRCLFRTKAPCEPVAHGRIIGMRDGKSLTWQHMVLSPADGPLAHMLVIAEGAPGETPYVLTASQTDGWFAAPMLVENGTEAMLLHAPGRRAGSGSGSADIILSRHSQGWTTFSIPDWLDEAQTMMPPGFTLASGARVDLSEMMIVVPVSRAGDGACCPTGGTALIDLDMKQGNMIRVSRVSFLETRPVATRRLEPGDAAEGERE